MMREDTSDIACADTQQSGDHNPCYIPTKIGMVTGGSGSMEMAAVSSLHDILHSTVFQIIGIATQGKGKYLWCGLYAYTMGWYHNIYYALIKRGMVMGGSGDMEMAPVRSLHDVLYEIVFRIIGIATKDKDKHIRYGL